MAQNIQSSKKVRLLVEKHMLTVFTFTHSKTKC